MLCSTCPAGDGPAGLEAYAEGRLDGFGCLSAHDVVAGQGLGAEVDAQAAGPPHVGDAGAVGTGQAGAEIVDAGRRDRADADVVIPHHAPAGRLTQREGRPPPDA